MAATAYCTSNTSFHQHSLTPTRSQFSPVPRRTTLSPSTSFSSTAPILRDETSSIIKTIQSDENNNEHQIEDPSSSDTEQHLYIPSDVDMDSDNDDDEDDNSNQVVNDIDEEQFLAFVGLRSKMKKPIVQNNLTAPRLTKRLASPVCLLPLPKFIERVRKALYVQIPNLKSLSILSDIQLFCSTDDNAKAQSLLPRSRAQTRASATLNKSPKKRKIPKTELIRMTADALYNDTIRKKSKYVNSILQCNVVLDRLEQSTIDQIMKNSLEDDDNIVTTISTRRRSSCSTSPKTHRSLSITNSETTKTQTTITTMTTEKTVVKRKTTTTTTTEIDKPKRFKSVENDATVINNNDKKTDLPSLTYQRIYLKCFVCSKRQYVDKQATQSDVLHSHWLEHGADLSLNIYDSEIDSILTRVVEFFHLPKQHMLEGQIKTIFIYNSKEIRSTSTTTLSSNDSYIVID